jgi:hypothetical protein
MEEIKIIEYSDFDSTRKIFLGDEVVDLPQPTEVNFVQLIDAHNSLVEKVNELIKNTNKKDE